MIEKRWDLLTKKWVPLERKTKEDYLTQKVEAEYSLNRKNEDEFWKRFSHYLAHEIKNPLVSISTFTQLLPRYYNSVEFRERFLTIVSNDIQRLNNFVEQLITLAAPLELDLQFQDIEKVLKETLGSLRETNYPQTILVDWQGKSLPLIGLDFNKLKEALRNILINAMEAMPKGGKLTISTFLFSEDFIEIRFQDTGEGITPENLSQIFLPFFTTKDGHSGLGLTLTKKIIEAHRGFIEVKSEVSRGSVFSIFLPIHTQEKKIKKRTESKIRDRFDISGLSFKNVYKRRKINE